MGYSTYKGALVLLWITISICGKAQRAGIGTNNPDPSAALEIRATNRGFLPPRVALTATNDLTTVSSPTVGLVVYNTSTLGTGTHAVAPGYYFFTGTTWQRFGSPGNQIGDMQYWNGQAWVPIPPGSNSTQLTLCQGVPKWGPCVARLTTKAVTSTNINTASSGGNIITDGGNSITAKGVVWSTNANPTISLATKTIDGTGTNTFNSNITGLVAGTTYYVRAYATTNAGTAYGNEIIFNFQPVVPDVDGNVYPFVTIGTQTWMSENLRTTKYREDGSSIPVVSSNTQWSNNGRNETMLPMMCWFNNDSASYTFNKFGALYNWYAINPATNGNKNVCPSGWHIPSDAEWTTLTTYLGGQIIAGGKMKSTGIVYWQSPNTDATNSSGFSGLPGGYRNFNGGFDNAGFRGHWWSASVNLGVGTESWDRVLTYSDGLANRFSTIPYNGYSIRCIKD